MSGYPQNQLITLWRSDAELLVCHLSSSGVSLPSAPVVTPAIPAHLMLTAPAASVPCPACHGTGVFIAQAWRRCDCTPYPRQFKGALKAAFAA